MKVPCSRCGKPTGQEEIVCMECTEKYYEDYLPRYSLKHSFSSAVKGDNWNGVWDNVVFLYEESLR